jgi:RND family efflux transporter MFP subunit
MIFGEFSFLFVRDPATVVLPAGDTDLTGHRDFKTGVLNWRSRVRDTDRFLSRVLRTEQMTKRSVLSVVFVVLLLAGCSGERPDGSGQPVGHPWVKTVSPQPTGAWALTLSGEVRARYETPLSFQVSGRIIERAVDAGMVVEEGQTLFRLDARDLEENLRAARAEYAAAESALALAASDLERDRKLLQENHISRQAFERQQLVEREARTRLDATESRVELARNALQYASLEAPADGVLTTVSGESGQVVNAGQTIAMLAYRDDREVEVYLPEGVKPPEQGRILIRGQEPRDINLREVAGSVDALSRTLRTRYSIASDTGDLSLGSIVRVRFALDHTDSNTLDLPLGALDERGDGAFVWEVREGQVYPVPVEVLDMGPERVRISAGLEADARVVALGTHLLREGMPVRELDQ